jgi:hypothetical protein
LEVSACASNAWYVAPTVNVKCAPKPWADRIKLPRFSDLEIRSAPIAKYPRGNGGQFVWGMRRSRSLRCFDGVGCVYHVARVLTHSQTPLLLAIAMHLQTELQRVG